MGGEADDYVSVLHEKKRVIMCPFFHGESFTPFAVHSTANISALAMSAAISSERCNGF